MPLEVSRLLKGMNIRDQEVLQGVTTMHKTHALHCKFPSTNVHHRAPSDQYTRRPDAS
jgi:hypothetical protein